ncbi:MAG: DNRLRE domain-containing protein [Deltaproteobacteria bacterium]|nr:DNRLRE domain-containing protein [Deltaproteobacteria bacterium]
MKLSHLTVLATVAAVVFATTEAKAFPVALEPSKDNTLYDDGGAGLRSNGKGGDIFAGKTAGMGSIVRQRAVLAFAGLNLLPSPLTINSATLTLSLTKTVSGNQTVALHPLLADWGEGTSNATNSEGQGVPAASGDATWTHRFFNTILWSTPGGDFVGTASTSRTVGSGDGPYSWSSSTMVTDVEGWMSSPATNFGWIVIGNEVTNGSSKRFGSREAPSFSERPRLLLDITTPAPLDHFFCYKAKNSPGVFKFAKQNATIADAIMPETVWQLFKPVSLCTPANKNGEGVTDEETHLEGYQTKALPVTALPPATTVSITNQFHLVEPLLVNTGKLDRLLVPTSKCVDKPAGSCPLDLAPPAPANPVDHYACYKVTVNLNGPSFDMIQNVAVSDQFIDPAKEFTLRKPTHLCVAADKNQEGIKRPLYNLMCYEAKKALGEPSHIKQKKLHTSNQFGHERMDTLKEEELCVPSSIIVR